MGVLYHYYHLFSQNFTGRRDTIMGDVVPESMIQLSAKSRVPSHAINRFITVSFLSTANFAVSSLDPCPFLVLVESLDLCSALNFQQLTLKWPFFLQ